jgi:hypothetical protein
MSSGNVNRSLDIYIYKDGLELTYKLIFSELIQRSIKVELGIIYMQLELILI